jgi:hypothetical protein
MPEPVANMGKRCYSALGEVIVFYIYRDIAIGLRIRGTRASLETVPCSRTLSKAGFRSAGRRGKIVNASKLHESESRLLTSHITSRFIR